MRLITLLVIGIVLMSSAAVWAYRTYGRRLDDAPPLPPGKPPLSSVPTP